MSFTKRTIITAIVILSYTIIFYVFASKELYSQQAQIIKLYYPIGIVLGIITFALLNKFFVKSGASYIVICSLVIIAFLFAFTFMIDALYRPILSDYYKQGYSTLIGLGEYKEKKGNYITIHRKMLKEGIFAASIEEGFSNQEGELSNHYNKQLTYHINNLFIIYDWDKENLLTQQKDDAIVKGAYEYLSKRLNIPENRFDRFYIYGSRIGIDVGNKYYNVIVYARDGEFAYSIP